ncbi:hypothetical protein EJB05_16458, partial [Eragrostis curvula]
MKAAMVTILLLAAVVAAASRSPPDAVDHQPAAAAAAGGIVGPLRQCLRLCVSVLSQCWFERCANPPDPDDYPVCFLSCTNDAALCSTSCAADAGDLTAVDWTAKGGQLKQKSPLTECVTACGTQVTGCLLGCYKAVDGGNPAVLPICLINCTNTAMFCATICSSNIV